MSRFIDPSGRSTFGLGTCARCWRKFSLEDLHSDPNSPGLKVCLDDLDDYDPYRLPARRTEDVTLRFYRTDEDLDAGASVRLIRRATEDEVIRATESGKERVIEDGLPEEIII